MDSPDNFTSDKVVLDFFWARLSSELGLLENDLPIFLILRIRWIGRIGRPGWPGWAQITVGFPM